MPSKIIQSVPVCIAASVALSVDPLWPLRRFFDIGLTLVYAHVSHQQTCRTVLRLALNDPVRVLIHDDADYTPHQGNI